MRLDVDFVLRPSGLPICARPAAFCCMHIQRSNRQTPSDFASHVLHLTFYCLYFRCMSWKLHCAISVFTLVWSTNRTCTRASEYIATIHSTFHLLCTPATTTLLPANHRYERAQCNRGTVKKVWTKRSWRIRQNADRQKRTKDRFQRMQRSLHVSL